MYAYIVMFLLMAWCIGENRPLPPSKPSNACWIFPAICWKFFIGTLLHLSMLLICLLMASALPGGSCIVKASPLKIHPKISLLDVNNPSSCFSFFSEIGSPSEWPVTLGGGKIAWMPCIILLDR